MMPPTNPDFLRHQYGLLHNRYQDMMALIGYSLWETNDRWHLTYVSPLIADILQKPAPLLMKQPLFSLGSLNQKDKLTRQALIAMNQQAPFENLSFFITGGDGHTHHLRLQGIPLFSEENEDFIGYRGLIEDITREMHALVAAQSSHRQLDLAMRAIPEGFALFDSHHAMVTCNQRFKDFFPSLSGMLGTGIALPTLWQAAIDKLDMTDEQGGTPPALPDDGSDACVRLRDKRIIRFRLNTSEAGDSVIIGEDLTQFRAREQALFAAQQQAEKMLASRSLFIANLSHELRTPLNAIIGFSELTAQEFYGALGHEKYKDYAQDILNSAQHLLALINDILELSKAEAGQLKLFKEEIDVIAALKQVIVLVRELAERKGIRLQTAFHAANLVISVDERKVKQIVLNLLSNAIKFTPTPGTVTLSTQLDGNTVLIEVADTGIGLSDSEIQQALAPFGQVLNSDTKEQIGTGLGLPLVKAMTELHGGQLNITSQKGAGTTVSVRLPVS